MFLHFKFALFFAMAAFDAQVLRQNPNRLVFLENQFQHLFNEVHHLRGIVAQAPPPPPPVQPFRPNLTLPTPPNFSGVPSELPTFKLKLFQFLMGNHNTYADNDSQLLFAGSLLSSSPGQEYHSLVNPSLSNYLHPTLLIHLFKS